MIINPNRILKDSIPAPDEQMLKSLISQTYSEIGTLRLLLKDNRKITPFPYFNDFLRDSLITNSEILLSISKLSATFLNSTFVLMRTFLEIMVDFLWMYSIFLEKKENGENLAKRFYQIGAQYFLSMSARLESLSKTDPFVKKAGDKININQDAERARNTDLIELIDKDAGDRLQKLQKFNWRALPGLIQKERQIQFEARSKKAKELAAKLFNLKAAPYQYNWKLLNAFTHWSPLHYKYAEEEVASILHDRNLNVHLGFVHDMISVCYRHLDKNDVPQRLKAIQSQFIYFST